ncbi:MAG: metal-dependent transcriptional regulator, partial [Bacteroidetes bacterium]|nr:metal-dependent transcriptional regulator [Bacteroidota bacterium]
HLQQEQENVSTNALAEALHTKPASVTDMLKKLKTQKLLQYEKYYGVRLTPEGRKVAIHIIRKHRLWECFLVEKLQFGWEEVHEIAEELEHISSKKLVDRLDAFLDYPKSDPHGDPIPDINGKIPQLQQLAVSDLPLNSPAIVNGIGDQSQSMLELLRHKGIQLGTRLEVKKKFDVDGSIELKIRSQQSVTISDHVAKNLLVAYENKTK